jgi:acetyl-CoA acetyltransferase
LRAPPPSRDSSRAAAIVGVGETDYRLDYQAARQKLPGRVPPTPAALACQAFERALIDSGLNRSDIDGVSVSFQGGPGARDMCQMLGLKADYLVENGSIMAGPLQVVSAAIAAGKCNTVAMLYAVASRSIGRQYGGTASYKGDSGTPASYYYYHPWGWSSQAAHWALMWQYYRAIYGAAEADLGAVAVQLRTNALANENAIMRAPLTIEQYLQSPYIVRPLHLFDLCLVNDGGVCLIVRRTDQSRDLPHAPALIAGWGESKVTHDKLHSLVRERLASQLRDAGDQALSMAGLVRGDVQHFEGYDASTIHLIAQLEGYGLVAAGSGLEFCKAGQMALGGELPVNINGGMLSGSYMHGWNHIAEITRQLRHEAGPRQIEGVAVSMFSLAQTDQVNPIVFERGAA